MFRKENINLNQFKEFLIIKVLSWPCWNAHTHLLPTFRGEVEAPEVLVVVKLRLCRTGEFAAKDPELAAALGHQHRLRYNKDKRGSVADPDPNPNPPDPYVFGPSGSGSISQRYGSGSFYHHAKIVRKTLIPTIL